MKLRIGTVKAKNEVLQAFIEHLISVKQFGSRDKGNDGFVTRSFYYVSKQENYMTGTDSYLPFGSPNLQQPNQEMLKGLSAYDLNLQN